MKSEVAQAAVRTPTENLNERRAQYPEERRDQIDQVQELIRRLHPDYVSACVEPRPPGRPKRATANIQH